MIEIENIDFWLSIFGLTLAILDFTGLKVLIENLIDRLVMNLRYFIFEDQRGVSDKMEMVAKAGLLVAKHVLTYIGIGIGAFYGIAVGGIILLIIFTVASLGLGMPLIAAGYVLISGLFGYLISVVVDIGPYIIVGMVGLVVVSFALWGIMRVAQPVVLFFPWSLLLPVYWIFKLLNMFPGKMLGSIGLLLAIVSTLIQFQVQ